MFTDAHLYIEYLKENVDPNCYDNILILERELIEMELMNEISQDDTNDLPF